MSNKQIGHFEHNVQAAATGRRQAYEEGLGTWKGRNTLIRAAFSMIEAIGNGILAVAHEQRTTNLIALANLKDEMGMAVEELDEIEKRLGMEAD